MNTAELTPTLTILFGELINGASPNGAFMLNGGDPGLFKSLDALSATAASTPHEGGASIAAHVNHLSYGLSLLNRWTAGENPFADADWKASWEKITVSEEEWSQARRHLREQAERWLEALDQPRNVELIELNGMIGSIAHLAYHFGAIRQMDRSIRGPSAQDS